MTPMWIKVCGMTTPEAVQAALDARVDAIGFVFAESKRRVTPERAAELAQAARGRVRCVAVTKHPTQSEVDAILEVFRPDVYRTALMGTGDVLPGANSKVEGSLRRLTLVTAQQGTMSLADNNFFDGGIFDPDDIPGYLARLP